MTIECQSFLAQSESLFVWELRSALFFLFSIVYRSWFEINKAETVTFGKDTVRISEWVKKSNTKTKYNKKNSWVMKLYRIYKILNFISLQFWKSLFFLFINLYFLPSTIFFFRFFSYDPVLLLLKYCSSSQILKKFFGVSNSSYLYCWPRNYFTFKGRCLIKCISEMVCLPWSYWLWLFYW